MYTPSTSSETEPDSLSQWLAASDEDAPMTQPARASNGPNGWWRLGIEAATLALLLRQTLRSDRSRRPYLAALTTAIAGATVADAVVTYRRKREPEPLRLHAVVTVNRSVDEVYRFWRDFRNLAKFMQHLDSVEESNGTSVWHARGPAGVRLTWEATIVADKPNERIAWRSLEGAELQNYGHVTFVQAPAGRGTEVHVEIGFDPPLGLLGARVAKMFGAIPELQLKNDLRRFKQVLETGDVAKSDASIHRGPHPARPAKPEHLPLLKGTVRS